MQPTVAPEQRQAAKRQMIEQIGFDADLPRTQRQWWEEGWQATAAPATPRPPS